MPEIRAELSFSDSYISADFERIKCGLIPEAMEDKWFVFFEEPWLYFHRSWTGAGIYGVKFQSSTDGATVVGSWVNRNAQQYKETRTDYDRALLKFLIDALLLGRPARFPVPDDLSADVAQNLYQFHVAGSAYPEAMFPVGQVSAETPADVPKNVYRHHVAGNAYPEAMFPLGQVSAETPAHSQWWVRILRRLWR